MISIIVSSINPEQNRFFRENIEQTIGVVYELIVHDNRESKWGLCKIYNHYARISKYDILCFFHEDIILHTNNWGVIISDFLSQTPQAGVIGFAGATIKTKSISGWGSRKETTRTNLIQHLGDGRIQDVSANPLQELYSPVVVVDGLALIVTKKVWEQCHFDEITFPGFHLYDLDFSMQVAQHYTNYVCYTIKVEHLSNGSYTKEWFDKSAIFHLKWADKLPISLYPYPESFLKKSENYCAYQIAKLELKFLWREKSLGSILLKQRELPSFLCRLRLTKYVLRAAMKKIFYQLHFCR